MMKLLVLFTEFFLKGSVRSILLGAGLGLTTAAASLTAVQIYINRLISQFGTLSSDVTGLLALSGVHVALSSIIGAIVFRLTMNSAKVSLIKKSN